MKTALLFTPGIVVTSVPYLEGGQQALLEPGRPVRHIAVVLVSAVHNATMRAVDYGRLLDADELRVVHISLEDEETEKINAEWEEFDPGLPLEIVESPFRSLTTPILSYVRDLTSDDQTIVTLLLPEFVVEKWWHHFLHNQSGLLLKRMFLGERGVIVTSVPYHLNKRAEVPSPAATRSATE